MKKPLMVTSLLASLSLLAGSAGLAAMDDMRARMIEKAKKEGAFVVAGSNAAEFRDKLEGFRKKYPWLQVKAFDANTSATINRVVTEAKAGKLTIDMVGVDESGTESLAQKGLLKGYDYPHMKDMIANTQPEHGQYVDAFMNPRVQGIYNTDLVSPKDAPRNWEDMKSAKWKGLTLLSRSSEEFPSRLAWLWGSAEALDWEKSFEFFTEMVQNQKPAIGRGYSGGTKRVAAGDVGIFWFPALGTYSKLKSKGAPVEMIAFPKFPMTFRSYAIMKDAPNPAGSWLLIDYLMSPEGQWEYTDVVSAKVVVNRNAKSGKLAKVLVDGGATEKNAALVDPATAAKIYTPAVLKKSEDFFFRLLGIK